MASKDIVQRFDETENTWVEAIPEPYWTTKGLHFWQRWNEDNWQPQCWDCKDKPIFKTEEDYKLHWRFKHGNSNSELFKGEE